MTTWTVGELLEATHGRLIAGDRAGAIRRICLDSRRVELHDAFLAIRGPRFDAHAFLPDVVARGASCVIVSHAPADSLPVPVIVVDDTVQALGALAAYHRRRFLIPVIAVTGSCGKTTTKEFIAWLLSQDRAVLKTRGTENNHIGLPQTLLQLTAAHEAAVVELGSNHPGEIAYLAQIAHPTIAVITNIGPAHLEFFKSLAEVRKEKLSLLKSVEPSGWAIVPGDQLEVVLEAKSHVSPQTHLLTFGTSDQCGIQAIDIRRQRGSASIRLRDVEGEFIVPVPGSHNVENALAALACMRAVGGSLESVRERLRAFTTLPMRSELVQTSSLTIVNDCYNANPLSFARALEVLRDLETRRKVLIAGDMLELGPFASAAHQAIGRLAAQCGVDLVIAVGAHAHEVVHGASSEKTVETLTYDTIEELIPQLPQMIREGDGVLIKGSRKVRLEQVSDALRERCWA